MSRRAASVSQADIARAIRAAQQTGADAVDIVQPNGTTIRVVLKAPPVSPSGDSFEAWERDYEQKKTSRRRQRN
jgi:hypothetical protein